MEKIKVAKQPYSFIVRSKNLKPEKWMVIRFFEEGSNSGFRERAYLAYWFAEEYKNKTGSLQKKGKYDPSKDHWIKVTPGKIPIKMEASESMKKIEDMGWSFFDYQTMEQDEDFFSDEELDDTWIR